MMTMTYNKVPETDPWDNEQDYYDNHPDNPKNKMIKETVINTWKRDRGKIKKRLYSEWGKASINKIPNINKVKIGYRGGNKDYFWMNKFPRVKKQFPQYEFINSN